MKKLLILGIVAALACAAYALPTLQGPDGLLTVPTADVTPAGQFQIAGDWSYLQSGLAGLELFGLTAMNDAVLDVRALYGIGNAFEVGAAYMSNENDALGNVWDVNAKYRTPFTLGGAAWAVGAAYVNIEKAEDFGFDRKNFLEAYVSGTKAFNENFKGTASVRWAQDGEARLLDSASLLQGIAQLGSTDTLKDLGQWQLALGAEAKMDNGLTLVGEYLNNLPGAEVAAAARYPLTPALTAQVGYNFTSDASTVGLSYAFGTAASEE